MSKPARRSKRERKVNKKYTNDGWDESTLQLLRDSDPADSQVLNDGEVNDLIAGDDEFSNVRARESPGFEEEDSSQAESIASSHIVTPAASDDDESVTSDAESLSGREGVRQGPRHIRSGSAQHSRGVPEVPRRLGKASQWQASFGRELDDLQPIVEARDRWVLKGRDATIPSISTLSKAILLDWNSDQPPTSVEDMVEIPSACKQSQRLRDITIETARARYLPKELHHKLALGPVSNAKTHELPFLQSVNFGDAWRKDEATDTSASYHEGCLINTGAKIQSLAWTPQSDQHVQHLAVACRSTSEQRGSPSTQATDLAPAFSPSTSYPGAIQIWRFATKTSTRGDTLAIDFETGSVLSQVLACHFGGIREMKWMPTSDGKKNKDSLGLIAAICTDGKARIIDVPESKSAGTKCYEVDRPTICFEPQKDCIFTTCAFASSTDFILGRSDGGINLYNLADAMPNITLEPYATHQIHITYVLSIVPAGIGTDSHFVASSSAASDLRLTDLRAVDQDSMHLPRARQPTKNLVYSPHTRTWISTVDSSGRTDAFKASGTRIVGHGLRFFHNASHLGKFPQDAGSATAMAASPLHPYLLTGNTQGTIVCLNLLRKLLPTGATHKSGAWTQKICQYDWIPQVGHIQDSGKMSVGNQHTVSDGQDVEMPDVITETLDPELELDIFYGQDTRPGVSRFHEGFRPEKQDLSHGAGATTKAKGKRKGKAKGKPKAKGKVSKKSQTAATEDLDDDNEVEVIQAEVAAVNEDIDGDGDGDDPEELEGGEKEGECKAEVIYEEEQAVTSIAWNVNPKCASWAAIGWGSGILRVQDLSHDAK